MMFEIMSPYDIASYFGKNNTVIIDIREKEEYDAQHIPTAKHYTMLNTDDQIQVNTKDFLLYDNIIIYCQHGTSSIKVGLDLSIRLNKLLKEENKDKYSPERTINVFSLYGGISNYPGKKIGNGK